MATRRITKPRIAYVFWMQWVDADGHLHESVIGRPKLKEAQEERRWLMSWGLRHCECSKIQKVIEKP